MKIIDVIKSAWGWVGIDPEKVVAENEFGNLIIRDISGKYWRLCPEDSYCSLIANNRSELDQILADPEFVEDWAMSSLINEAKAKLGELEAGYKYHLTIPGVLGGEYSAANIVSVPQSEQLIFSGDVARQIETLPDGAQIELKVIS